MCDLMNFLIRKSKIFLDHIIVGRKFAYKILFISRLGCNARRLEGGLENFTSMLFL